MISNQKPRTTSTRKTTEVRNQCRFICLSCKEEQALPISLIAAYDKLTRDSLDCEVVAHDIGFVGLCDKCRTTNCKDKAGAKQ